MLLATGIYKLGKKVADDQKEKKVARQGVLKVGDSDVARRAFASQTTTTKALAAPEPGINRAGTQIKYDDPADIKPSSPSVTSPSVSSSDGTSPNIYSPTVGLQETRHTSQQDVTSPVKSEKGLLSPTSPYTETPATPSDYGDSNRSPRSSSSQRPPPYSSRPQSSAGTLTTTSVYSRDVDNNTLSDTQSLASWSVNSKGTHAIRVKTVGADIKSGFPYHPGLFELHVHPDKWANFTTQIVDSLKFSTGDYAQMVGAATATACTGLIGTSVFVGRRMNRAIQEKKVRAGLEDMSDGGLGDMLKQWNVDYFSTIGLFAHMELSESAMKNPNQKSKTFQKAAWMYGSKDDQDRKKEERKFVIVVTKLDEEGQPTEAMKELELEGTESKPVEIGSSDISAVPTLNTVAELPADEDSVMPVELPGDVSLGFGKTFEPPGGFVEMDGDNTRLLEKLDLDEKS